VQHPPQICYTAQGWRIEEQSPCTLRDKQSQAHDIQRMIVSKEGERRVVYYFYTDGRHWTASYFSRVLHAFLNRAVHAEANTWVLIQLSTPLSAAADEKRLSSACLELFTTAAKAAGR
jgi:EpsI family protein